MSGTDYRHFEYKFFLNVVVFDLLKIIVLRVTASVSEIKP